MTPKPETLSELDQMTLEVAKSRRQTALAEAKTALANSEKAELEYRYLVLQLYHKYGLTLSDQLTTEGKIIWHQPAPDTEPAPAPSLVEDPNEAL